MYTKQLKGAQKVVIFLILLGISFITDSQDTTQKSKSILILGDSHLVGDFGEYLHRYLYKMDKYDITVSLPRYFSTQTTLLNKMQAMQCMSHIANLSGNG